VSLTASRARANPAKLANAAGSARRRRRRSRRRRRGRRRERRRGRRSDNSTLSFGPLSATTRGDTATESFWLGLTKNKYIYNSYIT
jgi:hypothetical protein